MQLLTKSQDPAIAICKVLENAKKRIEKKTEQIFRPTYRNISKKRKLKTNYRQAERQQYIL